MSEVYHHLNKNKIEVIKGEKIVMMSPAFSNHGFVNDNLLGLFRTYLKGQVCIPFGDGRKVVLEKGGYVIPDMFVVCDRSKVRADGVYGAPDLVVEVLSPSTRKHDRGVKKNLYQEYGVKEYWIVEPDIKVVEVYLLKDNTFEIDGVYSIPNELEPEEDRTAQDFTVGIFPELVIKLEDVFEYVIDW